ncbi:MAG: hypothetical protein JWR45_2757 [Blastococcus sp.]|jgi:uncharacterized membrane protein YbhN (UPF0104 family)|nr:hypothetical protein [Blastococcus sp.]
MSRLTVMVVSPPRPGRDPAHLRSLPRLGAFWPRPRIRRPVDVARLVLVVAALACLLALAVSEPDLLSAAARLVPTALTGLPQVVLSIANVLASLAVIAILVAIVFDAVRSRPFGLTSAALACVVGMLTGLAVASLAGVGDVSVVPALVGPPHDSAGLPVTAAVSLVVGADLRRRHWRWPARLALAAAVLCSLALGTLTVPSAAYAVLIGATAGLAVRVACGVLPARPTEEVIRAVLAAAGWPVTGLRKLPDTAGRARFEGIGAPGGDLSITVADPDRQGVSLAHRMWRLLRLRAAAVGRPPLSLRGELERQALSDAVAQSVGVAAPRMLALLAAGPSLVLVEQPPGGTPLPAVDPPDAPRGVGAAMRALRRLHDAGLAHGASSTDGVVLLPDGQGGFVDLSAAQPAATELQRELDVVALLVTGGRLVGAAEVATALRTDYGTTPGAEARLAALLQPLALPVPVRRTVRGTSLLDDLRTELTAAGTVRPVGPVRLERLRPRVVVGIAAATLAAHILATQLSTVGLAGALREAQPGWLVVAVLGSAVTYFGAALALQAFVPTALPLARTMLVQLASSFVTLVTPPTVGHIGLNIRYLQRAGVPTATASASVAVKETVTVAVTVPVLLVCGWLSGVSASRLTLLPSGAVLAVLAAAGVGLAVVAAVPPTRRLMQRRLEPMLRRALPQLLATVSEPRRLATAVVGILVLNAGYAVALDASLRAFSVSLPVATLVVVYLAASTLGSAAPTPGGLGAVEAALVGGLTATGVPVAAALTAVLAYRTATFWLPAPFGWAAFVTLQHRGRL